MIKTLCESKAKLSELVELAGKGQEVLITVRGKVKARLIAAESGRPSEKGAAWARELLALHKAYGTNTRKTGTEDVLAAIREDRL
jgi:prevent-host-death family protein